MAYDQSHANSLAYDIPHDSATIYDIHNSAYFDGKVDQPSSSKPSTIVSNVGMMSPQQVPANAHFRKDSFANSAGVLSPAESTSNWDHKPYSAGFDHAHPLPPTSAYQQDSNPFVRHESVPFFGHNSYMPWSFEHSDTNTPTGQDAFAPAKFETSPYPQQAPEQMQHRLSTVSEHHPDPGYVSAPQVHTPLSPQSHAEWVTFSQEMDPRQNLPKRLRPNSSPRLDMLERKSDGIRKKNARIDIPSDRNLESIERLLGETTNEDVRKELKGQKRLLRNREAALASRQRKKRHTEDLEVKEKNLQLHLQAVENQLVESQRQLELQVKDNHHLIHQFHEAKVTIEGLRQEKETLIINYTQETGNLRQKINYLTEQIEAGPAPAMSAAPSSTGFTDFNSDMDHLHLDSHTWATDDMVPGWDILADTETFSTEQPKSMPIAQSEPTKQHNDPPIASGILFMLLLCGAFVTSKASSGTSAIPRMPDDVKAASSTVLDSLLKNAGSDPFTDFASHQSSQSSQSTLHPLAEQTHPSTSWPGTNHLANLHHRLTSPSKAQEAEQIFGLTPTQYNSLTGHSSSNYAQHPIVPAPTGHRRRLGEMLQGLRNESITKGGAAEVYTRSLLWDQVPEDVVREFKKRVQESEKSASAESSNPGGSSKPGMNIHDGMFSYIMDN